MVPERNRPLPNAGVTVINAVPLASAVADVCCRVAGIESFGVLPYYFGERICTLLPGALRTFCRVTGATTPDPLPCSGGLPGRHSTRRLGAMSSRQPAGRPEPFNYHPLPVATPQNGSPRQRKPGEPVHNRQGPFPSFGAYFIRGLISLALFHRCAPLADGTADNAQFATMVRAAAGRRQPNGRRATNSPERMPISTHASIRPH